MVEQNLFLCLLLSALAGIFTIAGKVVVLQLARRRKVLRRKRLDTTKLESEEVLQEKEKRQTCRILTFFVFANIAANCCIFAAPWFGPVSIYWPAYIGSQLLANMLIVGTWLQQERFDKPAQVATLVVVGAVLFITIVGPGEPQADQDIKDLVVGNWIAIAWLSTLCLIFVLSFMAMMSFFLSKSKCCHRPSPTLERSNDSTSGAWFSPLMLEVVLWLVSITCSVLSATASKAASILISPQDTSLRFSLISLSWIIIICWSVENYLEGRHVRSLGRFLPAVTLGSIILNAITGMIVWNDAQVVISWAGYLTALCLLGMGVYLISDLDFFKVQIEEQQDYQRQIENWRDLFVILEDDLTRARVEQSLSRHQRTINSDRLRFGGPPRGNSDPELGTRTSDDEFFPNTTSDVSNGSIARHRSGSSFSSYHSLASVDIIHSPPRLRLERLPVDASGSATDQTLDSLERLSACIRNFRQTDQQTTSPRPRSIHSCSSNNNNNKNKSNKPTTELSLFNKTGPTISTATSDISGHSRDSSIFSTSAADNAEDFGSFTISHDAIPPAPPSPHGSAMSPHRSSSSPYCRTRTQLASSSPTLYSRQKSPGRIQSRESLVDRDHPPLQEEEEDEDGEDGRIRQDILP